MKNLGFVFQKIHHSSLLIRCGLAFGLGVLSAFSFAPWFLWFLLLIALSGLMFLLNKTRIKQGALIGFCFGFGQGLISLAWVTNALLIDNGTFAVFVPIALLGLGLFMGLFFMGPAALCCIASSGFKRWISFCCWFVIFEWIRSWLLTGFPWNLIGSVYTENTALLQFASIFGVYGLSFLTILTFTSFALLPERKPMIVMLMIFLGVYLSGAFRLYQAIQENVIGIQLRLVQPNIEQTLKWNPQKRMDIVSKLIGLSKKDNQAITHVIWPETAVPYLLEIQSDEREILMSAIRDGGTLMTGGLRVVNREKKQLANSIFILDHMTDIVGYADKSHLVPFGEYVPMRGILPLDKVVPIESDFIAGNGPKTTVVPKAPPASLLVCYEIIFPRAVVDDYQRPEWIVNVTNDGWYGISAGPYQHLGMAQLRAVEEGLPVIRVANTGVSAVISPYGEKLKSLPLGKEGIIDSSLPRAIQKTLYATWGNIPLLLLCIFGILFSFRKSKRSK